MRNTNAINKIAMTKMSIVAITLVTSVTLTQAVPLDVVEVAAPGINCIFKSTCILPVQDTASHFILPASTGDAFLQSRLSSQGEAGTPGEGLYPYLYRIDLRQLVGVTALPCVRTLEIEFGPVAPLDYDGSGDSDHVFVVTQGGLGSVVPSSANQVGNVITFHFNPPVCAGSFPGNGESTFFFGLASAAPPRPVTARIEDTLGGATDLEARAPELAGSMFRRGDANADGELNIADGIAVLGTLFGDGKALPCLDAADTNDSGGVDIADAIGIFGLLFADGTPPPAPFGRCGVDPTVDRLGCEIFPPCETARCTDPAARRLDFEIVSLENRFRGRVRITGVVSNVGGLFDSNPGQQALHLYEVPLGGKPQLVATQPFVDLAPGETVSVVYERNWYSASPAEGEFPPTYELMIAYDPDIYLDGNPRNDDCDLSNNQAERSGVDINALFR